MMEDDICSRDIVSRLIVAICSGEWCYNNDVCVALLLSGPRRAKPNFPLRSFSQFENFKYPPSTCWP